MQSLTLSAFIRCFFRHTPYKKGGAGAGMAPAPYFLRRVSKYPEEACISYITHIL